MCHTISKLTKATKALYRGQVGNKCLPCFGNNPNLGQEIQDILEKESIDPEAFMKVCRDHYIFSLENGRLRVARGGQCYSAEDVARWIEEARRD